jgi:hypothetical protein
MSATLRFARRAHVMPEFSAAVRTEGAVIALVRVILGRRRPRSLAEPASALVVNRVIPVDKLGVIVGHTV